MILEEHLATVMTNDLDPDKEYGIQVRCDSLIASGGTIPVIIKPMFPSNLIKVPDVGQTVRIFVPSNNEEDDSRSLVEFPDFIYYDHRIIDLKDGQLPSDFKKNYPKRCGMWTKDGSLFYFDETKNNKEFILKLTDGNNFFWITEDKITIDQNGTKIELSGNTMTTTVNTSKFGSSSAAEALLKGTTAVADLTTFIGTVGAGGWLMALDSLIASPDSVTSSYAGTMKTLVTNLLTSIGSWESSKHNIDQ